MTSTKIPVEALQKTILSTLDASGSITDTRELILPSGEKAGSDAELQTQIKGALDSLADREMIKLEIHSKELWSIAAEGQDTLDKGSPEYRVWLACGESPAGLAIKDLQVCCCHYVDKTSHKLKRVLSQAKVGADVTKIGQANAFRRKWISKQGDTFAQSVRGAPLFAQSVLWLSLELL